MQIHAVKNGSFALKRRWQTRCYEKLNRLGWPGGFGVTSHGVKIAIRLSDLGLISALADGLPPHVKPYFGDDFDCVLSVILGGPQPGTGLRKFHLAYHNHNLIARSHQLDEVVARLGAYFALTVAMLAPRRVFVHAGAVAWQGRAILIPGRTLSGKSTLVAELVQAGATYLSDEFALLDNEARVHPYAKPISLRKTPQSRQVDVSVEALGGVVGARAHAVGLVLMTQFKENARWRPRRLTPGEGVLAMLSNCPAARLAPERVLRALEAVASQAVIIASPRGEAAELVPEVLQRLADASCQDRPEEFAGRCAA